MSPAITVRDSFCLHCR